MAELAGQARLFEGHLGWHNNTVDYFRVANQVGVILVDEFIGPISCYEPNDEDELWSR